MCFLDSLSHFGSQGTKENKSSWPEIWEVHCDFSLTLKVKCPDSLNLLLKQSAWLKSQNVIEGHPYQEGYWRWLLCNLGLRRRCHWFMTSSQHNDPIKSETNSYPLDPLGEPQPQQEKVHKRHKMKVVFLTVLLGLVCATQEDETVRSASKVPGTVWSGRRSCVCVCVCVCVCIVFLGFLCWSISKLCPSHATLLHLLALYLFCLVYHLSCVLTDLCIFTALVTEKEDQKTSVGFESLHFRSELNLSLKFLNSFFHSDFYLIL